MRCLPFFCHKKCYLEYIKNIELLDYTQLFGVSNIAIDNNLTCFAESAIFKEEALLVSDELLNECKRLLLYSNSLRNDLHLWTVSVNFWHKLYVLFVEYVEYLPFCVKNVLEN